MRGGSSRALPTRSATGCSPAPPCGASRPDGGEAGPPRALSQLRRVAERTKVLLVVFAYQLTRSPVVVHLEQRPPAARSDAPANDREQLVPFRPKAHASPLLRIGSACMDVESPETLELEGEMRPQPLPVLRDTLGAPEKAHEHPVRLVRDELPLKSKVHHMLPARAGECAAELLEREIDRARAPASEPEVVVGGREARVWVADECDAEEFGPAIPESHRHLSRRRMVVELAAVRDPHPETPLERIVHGGGAGLGNRHEDEAMLAVDYHCELPSGQRDGCPG